MAYITPYKDGRWRAQVRKAGFKPRSKIFPTERQAKVWARGLEAEMDRAQYREPGDSLRVTVRSLFEKFRDQVSPTRKGARWETVRINNFLKTVDFIERRLDQLQPDDIRAWRDARLQTVTSASVNRELNLMSGVFSHAMKEWSVPLRENPVHLVKRPPNSKPRKQRWSEEQIQALLSAAQFDESKQPIRGRDYVGWALLLAIETAMRLGEMCSMRVAHVHLAERYVELHDTKNGDSRQVPLSTRAGELLAKLIERKGPKERVFPLPSESLGLYFREARDKAGLHGVRFHDTRHEAATRLSKKLANVLELSAVTGHRSLQSLKIYYNPKAQELAAKLD